MPQSLGELESDDSNGNILNKHILPLNSSQSAPPSASGRHRGPTAAIPPTHSARTLVLCFDGTGDQFDADNSNVVELFSILKKDNPEEQEVFYQSGIGTYTTPHTVNPLFNKISKKLDEVLAWNVAAHIMGGYEFLMEKYRAGDKICIFGFSRGAHTARCLVGMLHKVGLLPSGNQQQIPFAYKLYCRSNMSGWEMSNIFKKSFTNDVDVEFLGVWDSVGSVSLRWRTPYTSSANILRTFRHAVALDERRVKFRPSLWGPHSTPVQDLDIEKTEEEQESNRMRTADIDEVWFAGCHCDVGGGSVLNGTKPNLARTPLRWMIRECFKTRTGIMFNVDGLTELGMHPDALFPKVLERPPPLPVGTTVIQRIPKNPNTLFVQPDSKTKGQETEEQQELMDALSPIYDQMSLKWFWSVVEVIPMSHVYQDANGSWRKRFGWSFKQGRKIPPKTGIKVHRSVKTRMEAKHEDGTTYFPRANMNLEYVSWVD